MQFSTLTESEIQPDDCLSRSLKPLGKIQTQFMIKKKKEF